MARILKDGTYVPKPSAVKSAQRMEQQPVPMSIYRKNTNVKVFMGSGWSQGIVEHSDKTRCIVFIKQQQRRISVSDSRNIMEVSNK